MSTQHHNELGVIPLARFLEIFNVSKRTASNWRERGVTPYIKLGGKIYYRQTDIEALINKQVIK